MSFLLEVRCHLLDGNLCVPAGLLPLVPPLRAGLFQCNHSPSQALSFPGTVLLPCINPDAPQMSARVSRREGTGDVAVWLQMGWERRSAPFGTKNPAGRSHRTLPPQPGAEQVSLCCHAPFPFPLLGITQTFHELRQCKNPSDFWSESLLF